MALSSSFSIKQTFTVILFILASLKHAIGCYTSIFSFGDSLAGTGNSLLCSQSDSPPSFGLPPYGETYFHRPTGRCYDGRLIIDFIAESLGLPFVPPYFGGMNASGWNFRKGVNFAIVGATTLDDAFFEERGIEVLYKKSSLGVQLGWFNGLLPSLCLMSSNCNELLGSSLVIMGEFGGSDYTRAFFAGRSLEETQAFIPHVINVIASAIHELIELGAVTFLVPGSLPLGCVPSCLTHFYPSKREEYDPQTGCLSWLNKFTEYHNEQLQQELNRIQKRHPQATIIYADYYNAAMHYYHSPDQFGFTRGTLTACCGGGGPYNFNALVECGGPFASACDDPSLYVSWDGRHPTEAANRRISQGLLEVPYSIPPIGNLCVSSAANAGYSKF